MSTQRGADEGWLGLNGKGKAIVVLIAILQGLLFALAGFWVGQTSRNTALILTSREQAFEAHANYEARIRVLESHYGVIKDDIKDIKQALNIK